MEDKKQTAVEWFAERIQSDKIFSFERVLEKAKLMEEQNMIDTFNKGMEYGIKLMESTTRKV